MKFGAFGLSGSYQQVIQESQEAERLGFDGVFFGQHHQTTEAAARQAVFQNRIVGNLVLCTAVAARTERVHIGTAIHLLPLSHPVQVAEDTAAIDIVSGGRFILGVGIGYREYDFDTFGIPIAQRVSRFEEGLEIVRRAWTEDSFSFVGKRFTLRNVSVPKPIQKPHPPLWVGPWSMEGAKRAARHGAGFISDPIHDTPSLQRMITLYKDLSKARGMKPYVVIMREMMLAESQEKAKELYMNSVLGTYRNYWTHHGINPELEPWVKEIKSQEEVTWERLTKNDRVLYGSPSDIVKQIKKLNDDLGGIDYLMPVFIHPPQQGHEKAMEAMKLFAEKVIPNFR
ncbi:MAG: LLM class flavin-dependent oxidoreductase [Dehalococcoidia bacterium]|nr:LLM class flavin-dependent oxidoreductase [Dehalococcoidia bacterium]